ncbi:MAG: tripartite tricarboxylate transporter substrate binding protein [Proteobacteria bacterium]|nr:tripartite tricarboxylate transporter substrate binding protein [Burkholderiales bacterium]
MKHSTRGAGLSLAALALAAPGAFAQGYPERPIRYIVAFAPGGINDLLARFVGQKLTESWKQTVIVDNRPGAGGNLGAEVAARAAPDGYTLLNISTAHVIAQSLYPKLGYSLVRDLTPVVYLGSSPLITAVNGSLPVKSVPELIAWAKQNKMVYGSGGVGAISHLSMEMLKVSAGFDAVHVPYKGAGPAAADLIAGQIQVITNAVPELWPAVKTGKVRVIGAMSEKRLQWMPDVPTFAEQGVKGFVLGNWVGLMTAAGTPPATVRKLADEVTRVLKQPDVSERLIGLGFEPGGGTPAELAKLIASETVTFAKAVKASGATAD